MLRLRNCFEFSSIHSSELSKTTIWSVARAKKKQNQWKIARKCYTKTFATLSLPPARSLEHFDVQRFVEQQASDMEGLNMHSQLEC